MTTRTAAVCCCQKPQTSPPRSWRSRLWETIAWLVPGTLLALMPKCPVCLAGYLALLTGMGVPLSAAGYLRTGLILTCVLSLTYLAIRRLPRWFSRRKPFAAS